jgi:mono/diheme cytochrome c family protein
MMRRTSYVVLIVLVASTGCRRARPSLTDPMVDAIRAEEHAAGLTYSEALGRPIFAHYCAACHGDEGKGDGENAYNLNPPPPDFSKSKSMADAGYIRRVINEGSAGVGRSPLSPPYGHTLTAQQVEYLTLYCEALARKK